MGSLSRELKRWAVEELELPAVRLPDDGYIKTLCVGPGASIWKYITQHVYKERNVRVMRGNLQWYKVLQDKELTQLKNQNKDARRLELQSEINGLQTELNQLDTKITRVEDQLATADQDMNKNWEKFMDSRHRRLLMDSFRQRCAEKRNLLSEDTHIIGTQRQALEDLSKKAEMNLVFGPSGSGNRESGTDPMILRDVRDLCDDRVLFFRTLLESELKANQSAEFTVDQRNAVIQHWMSAAQNVLCSHPPNQVLSALQALTSRQQVELEEKIVNLDVGRDVSALGIRYESDHLIDVSAEQKEELASVQSLLQSAWGEVARSYVELAQTRCRRGQLEAELTALMSKPALALALDTDPLARNVFELELEGVKQVAVRDNIRQQFTQLQLQARQGHEAIRTLQTQWQSVMDFRQLLDRRQEQIRSLIKGNSSLKAELTRVQAEVNRFVQEKLGPQFGNVIKAASGQRNAVSQGAKHLSCVSLAALDCRVMNGGQKVPAAQLSIHRIQSPAFHKLCEGLSFPMYMNTKDILKKVGNQTALGLIHFYCMDTKPMQVKQTALGLIHFYCMDTKPMQVKVDQLTTFFKLSSFVFSGGKKFIQAPEELWSQATNLRLEIRILCRLLHLLSESTAELQTLNAQLPSPDQQTLLQRVKMTDEEILETFLPRARELTMRCSKGLVYAEQVKTAITHWWEQPGQFTLPEMQREGLTFQQWLQRWKLASKES